MASSYSTSLFLKTLKLDFWRSAHVEGAGWIQLVHKRQYSTNQWQQNRLSHAGLQAKPAIGIHLMRATLISPENNVPAVYLLCMAIESFNTQQVTEYDLKVTSQKNETWILQLMHIDTGNKREFNTYQMARNSPFERFYQAAHSVFGMPVGQTKRNR